MPTIADLIKDHKDKELIDPSAKLDQLFSNKLDKSKEFDLGDDTKLKLGGEAGADVLLLNESNKTDAALDTEQVFDLPRQEGDDTFEFLNFKPIIPFGNGSAWFRYRLFAKASASANTNISPVGISLDANAQVSASYYKKHAVEDDAGKKVKIRDVLFGGIPNVGAINTAEGALEVANNELTKVKTIFEKDAAINSMNPGDAVSFRVAGGLDLGVEVNLTDLLSGAVAGAGVFTGLLSVKYSAGVSFTASASVTDEFILIIAKSGDDRFDVAYRKTKSRSLSAGASVGVKVDIDVSNLEKLADEAIASAAEVGSSAVSELYADIDDAISQGEDQVLAFLHGLQPSSIKALDNLLPKLVEAPFESLSDVIHEPGDVLLEKIKDLKEALESSKKKLFDSFRTEGKSTLEFGIGLEYSRISAERDILRFDCNEATLKKVRKDLYLMDVKSTRAEIAKAEETGSDAISLTNYLREQSLIKKRTFSMGFTLLAWSFKRARTTEVRRNILKDLSVSPPAPVPILKVAYETTRSVDRSSTQRGESYAVSFGAQSRTNTKHPDGPTTDELDYTLGAAATYKATSLSSPSDLIEYLDTGMIYGALPHTDLNAAAQKLYTDLKASMHSDSKVSVSTGITIKGGLTRLVLKKIAARDYPLVAHACARAMTWLDLFPVRQNMHSRAQNYGPIFLKYFDRDRSNGALRQLLYDDLINCGEDIAKFEKYYASGKTKLQKYAKSTAHMDYFLGVVTKYRKKSAKTGHLTTHSPNDVLRDGVMDMSEAAQTLVDSWQAGSSYKIIEDGVHKQLLDLWENEFNGRFFGAYLNLIAQQFRKKNSAEFETVFRVNFTNSQKKDDHIDLVAAS